MQRGGGVAQLLELGGVNGKIRRISARCRPDVAGEGLEVRAGLDARRSSFAGSERFLGSFDSASEGLWTAGWTVADCSLGTSELPIRNPKSAIPNGVTRLALRRQRTRSLP